MHIWSLFWSTTSISCPLYRCMLWVIPACRINAFPKVTSSFNDPDLFMLCITLGGKSLYQLDIYYCVIHFLHNFSSLIFIEVHRQKLCNHGWYHFISMPCTFIGSFHVIIPVLSPVCYSIVDISHDMLLTSKAWFYKNSAAVASACLFSMPQRSLQMPLPWAHF